VLPAAVALLAAGCAPFLVEPGEVPASDCPGAEPVTHAVYLIGDAGAPRLASDGSSRLVDPVLASLAEQVEDSAEALGPDAVAVLFLGDNLYPKGLVPPDQRDRRRGERVLDAQIAAAGPASAYFTAGNHDWNEGEEDGWSHILEQRRYLASKGPRVAMVPPGGCTGPERVDVGEYLRLVFIDPIAFFHLEEQPAQHRERCPADRDSAERHLALSEEFDHPEGRHVVLATHHPLITAGPHGGHYTWKQHLFPLTDFVPWLWLPLPVVGSLYPLSRQLGVTETDVTSRYYEDYVFAIYRAATARAPMLVAAGHEHSLQVHRDLLGMYYAVSGAGSAGKVNRVEAMPTALMAEARPGYMRLALHADGALGLEVFAVEKELPLGLEILATAARTEPQPIYRACLAEGPLPERRGWR